MMSENPTCPYCGSVVPADSRQLDYDEKVQLRCRSCGGLFEYLPGFGAFSLPYQGKRQPSTSYDDGSFPGTIYEGDAPYTIERPPQQQSACGTCCTIICCLIGLFILLPMILFSGLFFSIFG
jgi:hypothetical protein